MGHGHEAEDGPPPSSGTRVFYLHPSGRLLAVALALDQRERIGLGLVLDGAIVRLWEEPEGEA